MALLVASHCSHAIGGKAEKTLVLTVQVTQHTFNSYRMSRHRTTGGREQRIPKDRMITPGASLPGA
jgi:hypothetical protein